MIKPVVPSIKLNTVPNTTYHLGTKNSLAKTYPTVVLPLVAIPVKNIIAIVKLMLWLKYMVDMVATVMSMAKQNIHLRPILSAVKGTNNIVQDQPAKNMLPIKPIFSLLTHTRSSYSTQLCKLVWFL